MKKQILYRAAAVLAAAAILFNVPGCSDKGKKEEDIVSIGEDTASLKVGMITDESGVEDKSFNQSAWEGLKFLNKNTGAKVGYIEETSTKEYVHDLTLLSQNYDVCWGMGYAFSDAVLDAAKKNPDRHFAIVDYEYDDIPKNVTCATFRSEEPSFLAGYIAGAVSESGKVGYIGGMDIEALDPFRYGFLSGVARADREYGRTTLTQVEFLNSFDDKNKGKKAAEEMYDDGFDVIFQAAGGAGEGVIEAAKEKGKYVIGVDCDQSYLAPDNVLTSVVKKVDVVISNISLQYGMNDNIGGTSLNYGIAEYALEIPEDHSNYSDEIYEKVLSLKDEIIYNETDVPSNGEAYRTFLSFLDL